MTFRLWRVMTSRWRHKAAILNFEPPSWIPSMQSFSWQWRHRNIYEFILRNILSQNKQKSKRLPSFCKRRGKTEKKRLKNSKNSKNTFWVDGCYGNANHHGHVIDTGTLSLINFRKSHEIWWLFVWPFKSYNSFKLARVPPPPPTPS